MRRRRGRCSSTPRSVPARAAASTPAAPPPNGRCRCWRGSRRRPRASSTSSRRHAGSTSALGRSRPTWRARCATERAGRPGSSSPPPPSRTRRRGGGAGAARGGRADARRGRRSSPGWSSSGRTWRRRCASDGGLGPDEFTNPTARRIYDAAIHRPRRVHAAAPHAEATSAGPRASWSARCRSSLTRPTRRRSSSSWPTASGSSTRRACAARW